MSNKLSWENHIYISTSRQACMDKLMEDYEAVRSESNVDISLSLDGATMVVGNVKRHYKTLDDYLYSAQGVPYDFIMFDDAVESTQQSIRNGQ